LPQTPYRLLLLTPAGGITVIAQHIHKMGHLTIITYTGMIRRTGWAGNIAFPTDLLFFIAGNK